MFGRIAAGLVHDLSHPIQNIGNSTRLLLRDDIDERIAPAVPRTIERELETLKRFMDDLRNIVKPRPIERFAMDVNGSVAEIVDAMRAEGERVGVTMDARYADAAADHRRRSVRARTRLPQPDHQRHPGDRSRAAASTVVTERDRRDAVEINVSDTGVGIRAGAAGGDLRRFRHDQAPRPGPRPGDLQAHRRAARRHHHRRKRSRTRHRVHAAVSGPRRSLGAGRRQLIADPAALTGSEVPAMFRTLVKTEALAIDDQDVPGALLRAAHAARAAPLQRRDPAGAGRPHHPRRRLGDQPGSAATCAGAGDAVQPHCWQDPHGGDDPPVRRVAGRRASPPPRCSHETPDVALGISGWEP